jgi:hypothetical protein
MINSKLIVDHAIQPFFDLLSPRTFKTQGKELFPFQ